MIHSSPNSLSPARPPTPETPEDPQTTLIRPTEEKERPTDVALLPNGQIVVIVETASDDKDAKCPKKCFVQIF